MITIRRYNNTNIITIITRFRRNGNSRTHNIIKTEKNYSHDRTTRQQVKFKTTIKLKYNNTSYAQRYYLLIKHPQKPNGRYDGHHDENDHNVSLETITIPYYQTEAACAFTADNILRRRQPVPTVLLLYATPRTTSVRRRSTRHLPAESFQRRRRFANFSRAQVAPILPQYYNII